MKPNEVILFIYDTEENYNNPTTQLRLGGRVFKDKKLIIDKESFIREFENIDEDQKFVLICHVFHKEIDGVRHSGFLKLRSEGIEDDYNIASLLVSSGDNGTVYNSMRIIEGEKRVIYEYSDILQEIKSDKIKPYTKKEILKTLAGNSMENLIKYEFGIITALYEDEFEEVKKHFIWDNDDDVYVGSKRYWIGHLIGFPERKIVATIPTATGMVDSSIMATQMLEIFKPKYLIMSGVCGGKEGTNFGDIVLAKSILTFQKGKVSELKDPDGITPIELFDKEQTPVDYKYLYDKNGKQISVNVETFEVEQDTIIEFDLQDAVQPELNRIKNEINTTLKAKEKKTEVEEEREEIEIHYDKIACSTMVINNKGYFEEHIKNVDRKIVAVEMESYGIARACKFANEGKSKWIIFKSVMDNMTQKDDTAKKFAAETSALFLKHLVYDGFLK